MKKHFKYSIAALFLFTIGSAVAQTTESELPEASKKVGSMTAFEFITKGGIFLIPIALLLLYSIFVMVERYLYIKRCSKFNRAAH